MIWNLSKRVVIARRPVTALGLFIRARGMIGRDFRDFDAMVFPHCSSIHTLGMGMPLDVLFLDRELRVCALRQNLLPWRLIARAGGAVTVVELPAGTVARTGTDTGDVLDLNAELNEEGRATLVGKGVLPTPSTVMPCRKN